MKIYLFENNKGKCGNRSPELTYGSGTKNIPEDFTQTLMKTYGYEHGPNESTRGSPKRAELIRESVDNHDSENENFIQT